MEKQQHEMTDLYERYKPLLFTLAYQLMGSAVDAEDAVQDVFVKLYDVDGRNIEIPKAYLCKMVTNRCLDLIKSARRRRELYFGMWLPEPLLTDVEDTSKYLVAEDLLSYGVLVLLERLSPLERVVFVLREALGLNYSEIAAIVEKGDANCRKLFSRAKLKLGNLERKSSQVSGVDEEWLQRFIEVLVNDDIDSLVPLLADNATVTSDGGGKVLAAVKPINQPANVARYLLGLIRKFAPSQEGWRLEVRFLNSQAGVIVWEKDTVDAVVLVDAMDELIHSVYIVRNPEKLQRLKGQLVI